MTVNNSGENRGPGGSVEGGEIENRETTADVINYWTPERRARAQTRVYTPSLPVKPTAPREQWEQEGRREGSDAPKQEPPVTLQAGVQGPPFPISAVDIEFPPYVKIGKLYFRVGNDNYTGSACVIGRDLLLTAAHNLYLNGVWSGRMSFIPAAWDDAGKFGIWDYERLSVNATWLNDQSRHGYDVGVVRLRKGGLESRSIGDVVGWLGYIYGGDPRNRSWRDVGYPYNYGQKRRMYAQDGDYIHEVYQGSVIGMTGELESGISGGPWLYYNNAQVRVYGLHSFHRDDGVYSPYFANWVDRFIQEHL